MSKAYQNITTPDALSNLNLFHPTLRKKTNYNKWFNIFLVK